MTGVHEPQRPEWSCRECGEPWPCPSRRAELLGFYGADRLALMMYLGSHLMRASLDLVDVDGGELYGRFLSWARVHAD